MSFIWAIIIGAIAGWLAEQIMDSDMGLLGNILLGIAGGVVGNAIAGALGVATVGFIVQLLVALAGACLLIWLARMVRKAS